MLQRAASNAYSWWWASHIRTKQSKWLEQSMQDMEEKVEYVLKLIQEDGDSFAKRAEMYYKKRPELIQFVEEAYRAFRALAERYDKLSTELQNANTTIATCFPEQVQFAMDDDDDDDNFGSPKPPKNFLPRGPAPAVPKLPDKDLKGIIRNASKKLQAKKKPTYNKVKPPVKSGLNKKEALVEIDKLQKDILALQTVKEFVKSSYESGLAKYRGIENEITEKQEKVSRLEDEFGVGTVIEDNDARNLMAEAALKSCQETLAELRNKQERSNEEARAEHQRIEDARRRLKSLKNEFFPDHADDEKPKPNEKFDPGIAVGVTQSLNQETVGPEGHKLEILRDKIKELEVGSDGSITVTELAEKIDDLVNKVINLETSVSSQTVLIDRLRTEADDLHSQIRTLEDDKASLVDGTHNLSNRVKELEDKLQGVQHLNHNVATQNSNLQTHFTEARSSLDKLSEKLQSVKPDEEGEEVMDSLPEEKGSTTGGKSQDAQVDQHKGEKGNILVSSRDSRTEERVDKIGENNKVESSKDSSTEERAEKIGENNTVVSSKDSRTEGRAEKIGENCSVSPVENQKGDGEVLQGKSETSAVAKQQEMSEEQKNNTEKEGLSDETTERPPNVEQQESEKGKDNELEEELSWPQLLLNGLEDKEKILMKEYTTILRNYKEVKKKLINEEKKNDALFQATLQVRELKGAMAKRDQEIQSLRQKLNMQQENSGNAPEARDSTENENPSMPPTEEVEEEIKLMINQPQTISPVEEKFRGKIDGILDENLDFWLRFSTAFHQVQKFKNEIQDLEDEIATFKTREVKKTEGKTNTSMFTTAEVKSDLKSDVRAVFKHLSEIKTELNVWLEQSESLKDEMQRRFSSLCDIQEAITAALKEGAEEDEITFSSHQAAKFQGEILNMKQENNKVNEELEAGIDHVTTLRAECEKTLDKLDEEYGLTERTESRNNNRPRIPLRSFIFGVKEKKKKQSILSYMQHHHRKMTS